MKKFVSVLLLLTMVLSVFVIAPATTADAATNSATSFRSGKFIKVGSYYFSVVYDYNQPASGIYRTKTDGTGTTMIGRCNSGSSIYAYNYVVYYSYNNKVYGYNVKTQKTTVLRETEYQIKGITPAGLVTQRSDSPLYLLNYKGRFKKISGANCNFLAATNTDVFISKVVNSYKVDYRPYDTVRVYRYNLRSGKATATGNFRSFGKEINGSYSHPFDFHVFKNSVVFTYGITAGTAIIFHGSTYSMRTDGTNIKKLVSESTNTITPGYNCVYICGAETGGESHIVYRIGDKGTITGKANNTRVIYTTPNNYSVSSVRIGQTYSYNLYANTKVNAVNGKCILNVKRYIYSSDPSDASASVSVSGAVGNLILASVDVRTYQNSPTWRGTVLRTKHFLIDVRNGSTINLY